MKDIFLLFLKPGLERLVNYIDTNNYWTVSFYTLGPIVISVVFGYVLSWFLQQRKLKKEIEKITIESKEKTFHLLASIQEMRKKCTEQTMLISLSVKSCIEAINDNDIIALQKNRDELIGLFFNKLIPLYVDYLEICCVYYRGDRKGILDCLQNEIFPLLQVTSRLFEEINNESILQALGAEKIKLKKYTLSPILRILEDNVRFYQFSLKKKKKRIILGIIFDESS